jgi:Asp-tRNA(Asn)/Glu-tRNA(Gln) amidotransferase A subunit family amidase
MNDRDLMFLPAHEQRQMVLDGRISSVELIEASLRRISEVDPQLNAFVTLDADGARAAAAESDRKLAAGQNPGLLHGIPICVKDLELTNGLRTTLGCAAFADWVPDSDSAVVERLRGAGAVILGKTNTPEFGNSAETFTDIFPTANNPWDITRHPGGSSGGTSAAIASGMCSLGTGSDGGGSVRLPASFTNIFGHKPTHGRTPRYGGRSMPSYNCTSTSGPMSQDVRSSAIMHMAISGHDSRDPGSLQSPVPDCLAGLEDGIEGMKIGFSMDLGYAYVNDDVARVTEEALKGLEDAGATVTTADISFDPVPATYWWTIWTAGQVAMYGHLAEDPNVELTDYTMEMVNAGYEVTGADYASALRQAEVHRIQVGQLFEEFDLLVTPMTAIEAWPHRQTPMEIGGHKLEEGIANPSAIPFSALWNILWNPAASVPSGYSDSGMPLGLQIIGPVNDDPIVFRASRAFELARPWTSERPSVS